jgi:hypothetical protein
MALVVTARSPADALAARPLSGHARIARGLAFAAAGAWALTLLADTADRALASPSRLDTAQSLVTLLHTAQ